MCNYTKVNKLQYAYVIQTRSRNHNCDGKNFPQSECSQSGDLDRDGWSDSLKSEDRNFYGTQHKILHTYRVI